jgi:hypothetical protein
MANDDKQIKNLMSKVDKRLPENPKGQGPMLQRLFKACQVGDVPKNEAFCTARSFSEAAPKPMLLKLLDKLDRQQGGRFHKTRSAVFPFQSPANTTKEIEVGSRSYTHPNGWVRYSLPIDKKVQKEILNWPVAYHGTDIENIPEICLEGLRVPTPSKDSPDVEHGQWGADESEPVVYLSPSIEYCGHQLYSKLHICRKENICVQMVLQVRVEPNSFKTTETTYTHGMWPENILIDAHFKDQSEHEWLVADDSKIVVTDILVRMVGEKADSSIFGEHAVVKISNPESTALRFSKNRSKMYKDLGLYV